MANAQPYLRFREVLLQFPQQAVVYGSYVHIGHNHFPFMEDCRGAEHPELCRPTTIPLFKAIHNRLRETAMRQC
jgi:hypothetical protein